MRSLRPANDEPENGARTATSASLGKQVRADEAVRAPIVRFTARRGDGVLLSVPGESS
jgi:hypothetical protein